MGAPSPVLIGSAPLAVLVTFSLPSGAITSQAQPEPNCVTPACLKSSLNLARPPRSLSIFAASAAGSLSPPPLGDITCQNRQWFQCWPAWFSTGRPSGPALPASATTCSSV